MKEFFQKKDRPGSLLLRLKVGVKVSHLCPTLQSHGLYSSWNSLGQDTGVRSLSLLQGIFPTQGSNPGLLHCRWILYQLSHQGSTKEGGEKYAIRGKSFI